MAFVEYKELIEILFDNNNFNVLQSYVMSKFNIDEEVFIKSSIKQKLSRFYYGFNDKWKQSYRKKEIFFDVSSDKNIIRGRPKKSFEECSDRGKRYRSMDLRLKTENSNELRYAFELDLRVNHQNVEAQIVHNISIARPNRKRKVADILKNNNSEEVVPFTPTEALALLVDAKLSKNQYNLIRFEAMRRNIFPSYANIVLQKNRCYPEKKSITIGESGASVDLQSLLDHTVKRLVESENITETSPLQIISKYGMDSSSGQSQYKQIFKNNNDKQLNDASVFMISLVPLQLKSPAKIIWENPMPSSTKLCRPIRFYFAKETIEFTKQQHEEIRHEVSNLVPTNIPISD